MLRKTLNSEIFKNSSGRVRVAKKSSGRVAGTRQALAGRSETGENKKGENIETQPYRTKLESTMFYGSVSSAVQYIPGEHGS